MLQSSFGCRSVHWFLIGRRQPDAFGNALGNSIVGHIQYEEKRTQDAAKRLEQFTGPDGKPLYRNVDQRDALLEILKQDPTMTPEKFAKAQENAGMANAVYWKDAADSTKGYRDSVPDSKERINFSDARTLPKELQGFRQDDFQDDGIGFHAGLFRDKETGDYTLAFRGTDDGRDWTKGNIQALDPDAPQYKQAINLATKLQDALGDQLTDITGHSLGGGLTAAVSMMTGIRGTSFNAAGLNPATITSRGGAWSTERADSLITNYRVRDELLTGLQERGSLGSLPLGLLTPAIGPSAIVLNAAVAALPNAAGRQITINAFNPSGQSMSFLARNNVFTVQPLGLHGMDYVMRGMLINHPKGP